ncbi:MAG: hypothetical protein HXX18_06885 [Bacteroidetes bacterium]|nr:hypothetical protein [Bacteroidota bacterium]
MNIITEYPAWMIVFCIIAGIAYSAILYYKNRRNDFSPLLSKLMSLFRFLAIFFIAFLLLSPLLKTITHSNEKPIIIFAQDNSQSILISKDSSFYKNEYKQKIEKLIDELGQKYDIKSFSFDDKVNEQLNFDYKGKQTDISALFDDLITRYTNRNVGAIIIASDGIYNKGNNPLYVSDKIKAPIYTLALGDTSIRKDLLIQKVNFNRITYLGNTFPIEVVVNANKAKGLSAKLKLTHGQKELFNKTINFSSEQYSETINITTEAKEIGLQRYTISISPVNDEIILTNNRKDIFIDVLDARQKILLLAANPHPDVSAIKQTLEGNRNYDVQVALINDFTKPVSDYNLVILHQLPANNSAATKIISDIQKANIPLLYILGTQSNISQFNAYNTGLNIAAKNQVFNESLPSLSSEFSYFTISDETRKMLNNFPPLNCIYGNYKSSPSAEPFLIQKIGNVISNQPLILFNQSLGSKNGIITGEGLWKWKLSNYAQKNNSEAFDEIITKIVQYLSVRIEKGLFRVINSHVFNENQNVEFDAELYNDSYELINENDVNLTIINSSGKKFPYQFNKTSNAYHLNAGVYPQGDYKYQAVVKLKNKTLTQNGEFTVMAMDAEFSNTIANHELLYNLAKKNGGEMLYPSQIEKLADLLQKRDDIKLVKYTQKRFNDLINLYWIFFIIIALLSAEWFLRKRNGGY